MSCTKLANLTVDQLVERFVAIALDQHEAMRHDDNAKYNRLYGQMDDVKQELKSRGRRSKASLACVARPSQCAGQAEIRDNNACAGARGRATSASGHQRPARISSGSRCAGNDACDRRRELYSQLSDGDEALPRPGHATEKAPGLRREISVNRHAHGMRFRWLPWPVSPGRACGR